MSQCSETEEAVIGEIAGELKRWMASRQPVSAGKMTLPSSELRLRIMAERMLFVMERLSCHRDEIITTDSEEMKARAIKREASPWQDGCLIIVRREKP